MKKSIFLLFTMFISLSCLVSSPVSSPEPSPIQSTPTILTTKITKTPMNSATPESTNTPAPTKTKSPTLTPTQDLFFIVENQIKTSKSPELINVFNEYSESIAYTLDDYTFYGAREHTLFPKYMDFQPEEFLIVSKVKWEHTSAKITASAASCGFMFRYNEDDKSYFAVISADGNTRLINIKDEYWRGVAHKMIKSQQFNTQTDEVELLLAVLPERFVMAVDGEIILDKALVWDSTGYFGYSLISGTNRDYGTRCSFSDSIIFVNKETESLSSSGG